MSKHYSIKVLSWPLKFDPIGSIQQALGLMGNVGSQEDHFPIAR
jgi:hypothetical protein